MHCGRIPRQDATFDVVESRHGLHGICMLHTHVDRYEGLESYREREQHTQIHGIMLCVYRHCHPREDHNSHGDFAARSTGLVRGEP